MRRGGGENAVADSQRGTTSVIAEAKADQRIGISAQHQRRWKPIEDARDTLADLRQRLQGDTQ